MDTTNTLSLWSLVMDGGYIMIPLAILLVVSIYIMVERSIALRRAPKDDDTFMKRIRDYVMEGDIENAVNLCRRTSSSSRASTASGAR